MPRRPLLLSLVAGSALLLAGCAGGPDPEPGSTDPAETPVADVDVCATPSGAAVEAVDVAGDFGTAPTVTFEGPLSVEETERLVLVEGEEVDPGALVSVALAVYNGDTGESIVTAGWAEGEIPEYLRADLDNVLPGFAKTLGCLGPGTRAVGVIPAAEAGTQWGIEADGSLVFVVDVIKDAAWTENLPEVGGTAEAPTVTLPATAPEPDLRIAVLEEGDGAVVGAADTVTVHYLGTAWETGEIFDQSYSRGAPSTFQVQGVVAGFAQALTGQKVGSRVIVSMPPALGYGEEGTSTHALAGKTLVFLIDIVSVG